MTYTKVVSRLTPSEFEAVKHEYKVSKATFVEKAKEVAPRLTDEEVSVLKAEFDSGRTRFLR
jgi:hypothetical protein